MQPKDATILVESLLAGKTTPSLFSARVWASRTVQASRGPVHLPSTVAGGGRKGPRWPP